MTESIRGNGTMLKRRCKTTLSHGNKGQSKFQGSDRELRGQIIRHLVASESISESELISLLNTRAVRVQKILLRLHDEGFIDMAGGILRIRQ